MKSDADFSLLNVLDLPDPQREIVLYLARNGPADAKALAQATGLAPADVFQHRQTKNEPKEKSHV